MVKKKKTASLPKKRGARPPLDRLNRLYKDNTMTRRPPEDGQSLERSGRE